jgi:hypothetical protein
MSQINNFSDSAIIDGMGILTLLDTEYLDEFDYGNLTIKPQYGTTEEEPEAEKVYIANPNNRYTYRPMLEIIFPD